MIVFTALLDFNDVKRWLEALDRVLDCAHFWADKDGGELNRKCARDYANKVLMAISSNRYSYHPYTNRYADWKYSVGFGARSFWQLKGDLTRALKHFREEGGWKGGIPYWTLDTGGKSWYGNLNRGPRKSIAMYGIVMEFGGNYGEGGRHPARPVFWPIYKEFSLVEWPRAHWVALQDIGSKWR